MHNTGKTDNDVQWCSMFEYLFRNLRIHPWWLWFNISQYWICDSSRCIFENCVQCRSDLQQFSNLKEIFLEYLESNLYQFNQKVEYIIFNGNKIKSIGENFFDYLPNLRKAEFLKNDCINDVATDAAKLNAIKEEEIKERCSLTEPGNGEHTSETDGVLSYEFSIIKTNGTDVISHFWMFNTIQEVETLHFVISILRAKCLNEK